MTERRNIALALLMHMVLQCLGEPLNPQSQKFNAKYRENEKNFTTQSSETTTIFPVNPYVFSAEDYDILQDAESLQQAMSIVTYESQKIDPTKSDSNNSINNRIIEKPTQSPRTTQLPLEKKFYEVPRKTRGNANVKKESTNLSAVKLVEEASSPRQAFEVAPSNSRLSEIYHRGIGVTSTPNPLRSQKVNQDIAALPSSSLPLYPPLTEPSLSTNVRGSSNNFNIATRSRDIKTDQNSRDTPKTEAESPTVRKKRRKPQNNIQPTQDQKEQNFYLQQQQNHHDLYSHYERPVSSLANDRIPRPFSLPTEPNPSGVINIAFPTRTPSIRQNTVRPLSSSEQTYAYPTISLRQSLPPPTVSAEQPIVFPTAPIRQNFRTPNPISQEQVISFTPAPNKQIQIPFSSREEINAQQVIPLRRNGVRQHAPREQTAHSSNPAEKAIAHPTSQVQQEQPIVYAIPRRSEQPNSRGNVSSRRGQAISRTNVPARQEQTIARSNVPSRQEQSAARYNLPRRQEQALTISTVQAKQEEPVIYPLRHNPRTPNPLNIQQTYSAAPSRRDQLILHTTASPRQEQTITRRTVPQRRRPSTPAVKIETYSSAPVQPAVTYSKPPSRRKSAVVVQDIPYERDVIPPTEPIEQNVDYSTVSQPIYVPKITESTRQRSEAKSHTPHQENNDYKDYSSSDNDNEYNDSNNNKKSDNDDNKHYSYSYVERYEEPLDVTPKPHAYKVNEDNIDHPTHTPKQIQGYPVLQKGAYKRVELEYDQDRVQHIDHEPTEADADYDQARGQNVQHEVAEARQELPEEIEDQVEEADHHHKHHHKPKDEHHEGEEGGSDEHHEGEHHEAGEKGHKGYEEFHEHDEGEKGHHDKEGHDHHYDEKEGKDKKHHEEAGFHEEREKGEEGEKKTAFNEKGDHKKGHSTKGEHVIHKKDEYEKKTEFFDEFHEGGDMDKDGGHHEEHHHKKGGHFKKGHHHKGHHDKKHGEKGKHEKGYHHHEKKGHDVHEGDDHHHHHEEKHGKKAGHEDAKKWSHKKGDRR